MLIPGSEKQQNDLRPLATRVGEDMVLSLLQLNSTGTFQEYKDRPFDFYHDILGVQRKTLIWSESSKHHYKKHKWDGTPDPFLRAEEALAKQLDVGFESGTGTGKTFWAALKVLHFGACYPDSTIITIAPKAEQLKINIWKEIGRLWKKVQPHFPAADLLDLEIRWYGRTSTDRHTWTIRGMGVGVGAAEAVATKASGFHAENMMFIVEEAPGVREPILNAIENTCTAPNNLRVYLGNPDHQMDPLHKFCLAPGVEHIVVSALDHPNIVLKNYNFIPGAVAIKSIKKRRARYGQNSRIYKSRVRGISPSESEQAVIRYDWLKDCVNFDEERKNRIRAESGNTIALGVDVANSLNGDKAALAYGKGAELLGLRSFRCPDANLLGSEEVLPMMRRHGIKAHHVGVDGAGIGGATMNELKRLNQIVVNLNGGNPVVPHDGEELFANLRAQMWWQLRTDLQLGKVLLPEDEELWFELCQITYEVRNRLTYIQSKKEIRKTMAGRSPDKADAVVFWNWVRQSIGIASIGGLLGITL